MKCVHYERLRTNRYVVSFLGAALCALICWPLCCNADDTDENSASYKDAAARFVLSIAMPFSLPARDADGGVSLRVRKTCARGAEVIAQVQNGLLHFDLSSNLAYLESFPVQIIDATCADKAHQHLLVSSWPDGRLYSISVKPTGSWSGWRRGDIIKLGKDERPFGYVDGEQEVRLLTSRRLITLNGDKVGKALALSKSIDVFAIARASIVRVGDDIYFGNDGGEWGGTLYRFDRSTGKMSLAREGLPVVSIVPDPSHSGCVLVARALVHITMADGELLRVCHGSVETLTKGEPVWSVAGKDPTFVAFSDGIGELQADAIVNRRMFPSLDQSVAGMHYTTLPGIILMTSGVSQSVSVSGPVPILAEWVEQVEVR